MTRVEGAHPPRAIVCDADRVSSHLIAEMLRQADFEVRVCNTAAECEAEADREPADLIVTAILLPDVDGLELTRHLRALYPDIHILIVSALRAAGRAIQAGADSFLNKPISPRQLVEAARTLVLLGGIAPA